MPCCWRTIFAVALLLTACSDASSGEPVAVRPSAAEAPTSIPIGERELVLGAYAWRDRGPAPGDQVSGPCDSLCVNGTIEDVAGDPLPQDVEILEVVAIIGAHEFTFSGQELRGFNLTSRAYEFWVGGGPAVEPGEPFDLAAHFEVNGRQRWLRADNVTLEDTR